MRQNKETDLKSKNVSNELGSAGKHEHVLDEEFFTSLDELRHCIKDVRG